MEICDVSRRDNKHQHMCVCVHYRPPQLRCTVHMLACRKKDRGGINFTTTVANPKMDLDAEKAVCSEYR